MKPLIVLITVFAISAWIITFALGQNDASYSGRIAMSVMLLFTAMGHFRFQKGMTLMIPPPIPFKKEVVILTGLFEILAAAGLLIYSVSKLTGILLIIFFIAILPANIYAAMKKVDYEKANYKGKGLSYLWFRIPLQILFIIWVYLSAINQ